MMCWSVPGKIIDIDGNMGLVEFAGITREICFDLLEEPQKGEYVLVHAGYAIQKVDGDKARFTLEFFKKKGQAR